MIWPTHSLKNPTSLQNKGVTNKTLKKRSHALPILKVNSLNFTCYLIYHVFIQSQLVCFFNFTLKPHSDQSWPSSAIAAENVQALRNFEMGPSSSLSPKSEKFLKKEPPSLFCLSWKDRSLSFLIRLNLLHPEPSFSVFLWFIRLSFVVFLF